MNDLCTACLCSGRNLFYVGETEFYHIYLQILNEIPVYDLSQICIRVCWECHAALRRFQKFKHQVKSCYTELLQYVHRGNEETKVLSKFPHLQTSQVTFTDFPEIKAEYDTLEITVNEHNDQNFNQHLVEIEPTLGQEFVEPLAQHFDHHYQSKDEVLDGLVKEEDHNELKTFVNDLDVKKKTEKKKKSSKVKPPKEKKKTTNHKKAAKVKKKKRKLKLNEVKSDVESSHDYDDDYLPFDDNIVENDIGKEDIKKLEDVDSRECDIYPNNELDIEVDAEKESTDNSQIEDPNLSDCVPKREAKTAPVPKQPKEKGTSEKPQCAECGKVFSSRKTLRYHLNVLHKGNNRYPCPRCGKVYQWKSNLGRHLRSHKARDTGELYCATCDKRFASVATYRQHLNISKQHVSENEFSFTCDDCGKKFVNKTRLRDHIDWEHLQKIKFRCQLCNKPFKCHTSLYVHMKNVHRNKDLKDNLCHVCGKSYQNAAKLRYHIVAMHTTQTPYQCEQCSAAFGWYSSLYRHVKEVHYKMKVQPSKGKKPKKRLPEPLPPMLPHMLPPLPQPGMP